jgi:hypothetical protein
LAHNSFLPEDVNQSGDVTPLDAINIINELNAHGPHALPKSATTAEGESDRAALLLLDVNADHFVSPIDALAVINYLNRVSAAEGEPSAGLPPAIGALETKNPSRAPAPDHDSSWRAPSSQISAIDAWFSVWGGHADQDRPESRRQPNSTALGALADELDWPLDWNG